MRIIAFSGSLRQGSYTTKLLRAFKKRAPDGVEFDLVSIGDLPLINEDLESDLPQAVRELHEKIKGSDAVLFATPEYNRSYSPVIKNVLDWGSRPAGQNAWDAKPAGIIGCSPYRHGGFGAVNHFRQAMLYVNLYTMQQPEFYLEEIADTMDDQGNIVNERTHKYIDTFWTAFVRWIENFRDQE